MCVPAAQKGNNTNSIAIALSGDGAYTMQQIRELKKLVNHLLIKYDIHKDDIWSHNEVSSKECPYFNSDDLRYVFYGDGYEGKLK